MHDIIRISNKGREKRMNYCSDPRTSRLPLLLSFSIALPFIRLARSIHLLCVVVLVIHHTVKKMLSDGRPSGVRRNLHRFLILLVLSN